MFRSTRGRILGLLLAVVVLYFLFFSSSTTTDFRRRTEQGLAAKKHGGHGVMQGDISDEALTRQTNEKLQGVLAKQSEEQQRGGDHKAPVKAEEKQVPIPRKKAGSSDEEDEEDEDNVGVAGRKTMTKGTKDGAAKPKYPIAEGDVRAPLPTVEKATKNNAGSGAGATGGDSTKDIVREKLQEYLKKPVVIFSKSYCPHSRKAKHLLLELYTITPPPLVVELDQLTEHLPLNPSDSSSSDDDHPAPRQTLGQALQLLLGQVTGRRTVPNVMVGMTSIGGNDVLWEMHERGELADKIRELGGKRVTGVEPRHEHDGEEKVKRKREEVKVERNDGRRMVEV